MRTADASAVALVALERPGVAVTAGCRRAERGAFDSKSADATPTMRVDTGGLDADRIALGHPLGRETAGSRDQSRSQQA